MKKYKFKATNLMAETFDERGIKFNVADYNDSEHLLVGFPVECGPSVIVRFISRDNDNDIAVRIFGLVSNTPKEKRNRIFEACNILNAKVRYVKFCCDADGDINMEYDFPQSCADECVGEMGLETLARMIKILDAEYQLVVKTLYSDEPLDDGGRDRREEIAKKLKALREMVEARRGASDDATSTILESNFEKTVHQDDE